MATCPECGDEGRELGRDCEECGESLYVADDAADRDRDPYVGTRIDEKYAIVDRISQGGMGTVYRAVQMPVDRKVAVKVLRAELESDSEVRERFRREARAISKLNHPNIITLFDFGFDESGYPYMVLEFAVGESLTEWNRDSGIDLERILRVLKQILSSLATAHRHEIVHRDLKPDNIMVLDQGPEPDYVKVLDFGVARILGQGATERLTREGEVYGTPHYMSPEQAGGEVDVGPPADVYAVGILLYEMLCGERPYSGSDALSIMVKHSEEPLPEITPRDGIAVPEPMRELVKRATAKDPDDRYETAGEMLEVLEEFEDAETSGIIEAARSRDPSEPPNTDPENANPPSDPPDSAPEPEQGPPEEPPATTRTPREESMREIDPDELGDDSGRDLSLDQRSYQERTRGLGGSIRRLFASSGQFLLALSKLAGALFVLLAAFMVIGARFHEFSVWIRSAAAAVPLIAAVSITARRSRVLWMRRFSRNGAIYGFIGFLCAHIPDPTKMAAVLADQPVWFLKSAAHLPGVEPAARALAWLAREYAAFVISVFG